jgi:hydroxyethylthiazole kinase-like sugar kinase family protein
VVPVVGNIVGGVVGTVIGAVGAFIGKWCARKAVGENVGARLKREQMEKEAQQKAAEEQAQKMESYNVMLMDALTYAQTDEELDEATASVLAKIQGRFMQVQEAPQEQVQTPEAA